VPLGNSELPTQKSISNFNRSVGGDILVTGLWFDNIFKPHRGDNFYGKYIIGRGWKGHVQILFGMPPRWGLATQHAGIVTKISTLRAFKNYQYCTPYYLIKLFIAPKNND
jgi:hypothetical protein